MQLSIVERPSRRIRDALRQDRSLAAVLGGCWAVFQISHYPPSYLFLPDRDIWIAQLGTWLLIGLEAAVVAGAGALAVSLIRKGVRAAAPFPGFTRTFFKFLRSKKAPIAAGVLSAGAVCFAWGLKPIPIVPDEAAYLLQARLFSTGHWTGPPAPLPEFFEQMYVFVSPFSAAKYPPGFPLALVPAIWLGIPVLTPILFAGVSGALVFTLARDVANAPTAALAWLLWTTIPHEVWSMPPYMSQHLSTALWLASWWALLRWRSSGALRHLLILAGLLGWGALTRPLTMLVAAVPIGVVTVRIAAARRSWGQLATAAVFGAAILGVIPLWSARTTGDWRVTPLALHLSWYTPYDAVGFTRTSESPIRPLPKDLENVTRVLGQERRRHAVSRIPGLVAARAMQIRANVFPRWRVILLPLAGLGLLFAPPEGLFAAVTALLTFLAHLIVAHPPHLSVYYVETYPVLAFLAALGIWNAVAGPESRKKAIRELRTEDAGRGHSAGAAWAFSLLLIPGMVDLHRYRDAQRSLHARKVQFTRKLEAIPGRAVVFVRYPPDRAVFDTFIENGPDLDMQRVWVVRDLGAENVRLEAIARERVPYLFVWSRDLLVRLDRPISEENRRVVEGVDVPES